MWSSFSFLYFFLIQFLFEICLTQSYPNFLILEAYPEYLRLLREADSSVETFDAVTSFQTGEFLF
jgi:hypothetical protein